MKMLGAATLAACVLATAPHANAGYYDNYAAWSKLSAAEKYAYAAGLIDQELIYQTNDDLTSNKNSVALSDAWLRCLSSNSIDSRLLAEMIDRGYNDTSTWSRPPSVVLGSAIAGLCRPYLDVQRKQMGLKPLPPNM